MAIYRIPWDQASGTVSQRQKTYPCPAIDSPEAKYVAICMLAGSQPHDIAFGLARRFPLPRHAPPHHVQWVSNIWNDIRQSKPPCYLEAEQLVSWLLAGALLRLGSWELGILVFNGWDVSADNFSTLKQIRREISNVEFNAAGVNAYLGRRSMMEGLQDSKYWSHHSQRPSGLLWGSDEDEIAITGIGAEMRECPSCEAIGEKESFTEQEA